MRKMFSYFSLSLIFLTVLLSYQNCTKQFMVSELDLSSNLNAGSSLGIMMDKSYTSEDNKFICAEEALNNNNIDAAPLIQGCAEKSKNVILKAGRYYIRSKIDVSKTENVLIATFEKNNVSENCNSSTNCAELFADDNFVDGPIIRGFDLKKFKLDHIILNGNKASRLKNRGTSVSVWGNPNSFNSQVHNCSDCSFIGILVKDTVRGTGMEFSGSNAIFDRVTFKDNGRSVLVHPNTDDQPWADGLTVHSGPGITISNSDFYDNSDVNLILGNAPYGNIVNNKIYSTYNFAFAGLMIDNFNGNFSGDYTGTKIMNNYIDGGVQSLMGIGLDLGPWLWYQPSDKLVFGGIVSNNQINNARIGLSVYGVKNFQIMNNKFSNIGQWDYSGKSCFGAEIDVFENINNMNNVGVSISQLGVAQVTNGFKKCINDPVALSKMNRVSSPSQTPTPVQNVPSAEPTRPPPIATAPSLVFAPKVIEVYRIFLLREPDPSGGMYFTNQLNNGASIKSILQSIAISSEFKSSFPASNEEFLNFIYQRLLKRIPDLSGYNYFLIKLRQNSPRDEVVNALIESNEFKALYPNLGL